MKRISKYLTLTGLTGLLCLFLAIPADAQRGGGHSGGGGGSHGGGGGGFHGGGGGGSHFSGGGSRSGGSFSRPSGSFSRPSGGGFSRGATTNSFNRSQSTRAFAPGASGVRGGAHVGGATAYRGGISGYRGGYSRGGRYYPGGYGRSFGYRYSPWYAHRGFYYNRGFYASLYYPRLGFSLGVLPYGYYPFWWGDSQFYYSGGYFYQYDNDQYTVVEPPIGAAINTLPGNAKSITINGQQYYEANGVYYTPVTKDDGSVVYQVAGKDGQLNTDDQGQDQGQDQGGYAPQGQDQGGYQDQPAPAPRQQGNQPAVAMPEIGDIFYSLPSDSRKIRINGQLYYVSPDDFYYQQIQDAEGKKAYKVTGTPDNSPD
ncbi:DUF6515 family protein [Mucilaginibacter sp. dw_454]|uniref:DUF6515 family protein n=1 Tax=Mucilaginibacter sp. dw_454 TaxID=2720079 RepID=UPI001BD2DAA8|nr:DUF6515 family protein [Mucilaginibacter sp. dw_454]